MCVQKIHSPSRSIVLDVIYVMEEARRKRRGATVEDRRKLTHRTRQTLKITHEPAALSPTIQHL
jgi:hypothetical protein